VDSDTERHRDDPSILDDEVLYRYIHPNFWVVDESSTRRISSVFMRFEPGADGISVYSAKLLIDENLTPEEILPDQSYGLASLSVGDAREMECGVIRDPNEERPVNFAHMLIIQPDKPLSRGERRKLSFALIDRMNLLRLPQRPA
jgi:hypothetical protein